MILLNRNRPILLIFFLFPILLFASTLFENRFELYSDIRPFPDEGPIEGPRTDFPLDADFSRNIPASKTIFPSLFFDKPYDTHPLQDLNTTSEPLWVNTEPFQKVIDGQIVKGFISTLDYPFSHFNIYPARPQGCPGWVRTSVSANDYWNCNYATNGGFFDVHHGDCIGNIIGDFVQFSASDYLRETLPNFGITEEGYAVTGYLSASDIANFPSQNNPSKSTRIKTLITGAVWLVRNGTEYWSESVSNEGESLEFVFQRTSRNGLGVTPEGRIVSIVIEGQGPYFGVTLEQFAKIFIEEANVVSAINIDGGGSTTIWYGGRTQNKPGDYCPKALAAHCERLVTSIVCFK